MGFPHAPRPFDPAQRAPAPHRPIRTIVPETINTAGNYPPIPSYPERTRSISRNIPAPEIPRTLFPFSHLSQISTNSFSFTKLTDFEGNIPQRRPR